MHKNIGLISTRLAGIDGVSLEASKWAEVLERGGHNCFWFAGELDKDPAKSHLVHEAHFFHPQNMWINQQIFGKKGRSAAVTDAIHDLRSSIKIQLDQFIESFKIDLLIIENALAIPLNIPLGLALSELISESQIPAIAHHHDFYWERIRFLVNAAGEYLRMAFPPKLSNIAHVVINSSACEELARRRGILATVIPNVLDFNNPPAVNSNGHKKFLAAFGLSAKDKTILQPTRIIRRKGVEHAIELVKTLNDPQYKLLISHEAGDEGFKYVEWIKCHARERGVDLRLAKNRITSPWNNHQNKSNGHSLWNVYAYVDFITFPSLYEGFGNAFLEAIYFKKPLLVNRYATFVRDIEPKGFEVVKFDGYLTKKTVQQVQEILESPAKRAEMRNHNYAIAKKHYAYESLSQKLDDLLCNAFELSDPKASAIESERRQPDSDFRPKSNLRRLRA